jgi:hypothetical protein
MFGGSGGGDYGDNNAAAAADDDTTFSAVHMLYLRIPCFFTVYSQIRNYSLCPFLLVQRQRIM